MNEKPRKKNEIEFECGNQESGKRTGDDRVPSFFPDFHVCFLNGSYHSGIFEKAKCHATFSGNSHFSLCPLPPRAAGTDDWGQTLAFSPNHVHPRRKVGGSDAMVGIAGVVSAILVNGIRFEYDMALRKE